MATSDTTTTDVSYSFMVHTNSTTSSDSPVRFENSANAKQKRRRTSPRDHAVLEAAYQRNSKPDKHERAEIVNQVELGEKEVQIWFQNRRQNDRRKSKPLQPHELLAHFRNGALTQAHQQIEAHSVTSAQPVASEPARPSSRSSGIHELLNPSSAGTAATRNDNSIQSQDRDSVSTPLSSFEDTVKPTAVQCSFVPSAPTHSRKRSHEDMLRSSTSKDQLQTAEHVPVSAQNSLSRSSSSVRLAMTVDGAVKVRTNNEPTPSPPKQRPAPPSVSERKREGFERSQGTVDGGFVFKDIQPSTRRIGGAGFGRSRDARTWEFYCDRESGDALSTQAEAERSGSAISAINLIRSRSQRNKIQALTPNSAKKNARRLESNRTDGKPKLLRAKSSMARLQGLDGMVDSPEFNAKRVKHDRSPSGDSDKENWAPGTRTSQHNMRRMHPSAARGSVLQENDFPSAKSPIIDAVAARQQENRNGVVKEKAKGDDLDCIQGLLSLSQGAWR